MRSRVALLCVAVVIACGPGKATPAPEQVAPPQVTTPPGRSPSSGGLTDGPDFDRTCHQLVDPFVPMLREKRAKQGDASDEGLAAEIADEIEQCIERMRGLHANDPRDFAWLADCLAKAKSVDQVETCRTTPRPLTPEEERERQTLVSLAKAAHHLGYYVAYHERCPDRIEDLVGEGMATQAPKDAWGNPLELRCEHALDRSGELQVVISPGPDGKPGTEDDYYRTDDEDRRGPVKLAPKDQRAPSEPEEPSEPPPRPPKVGVGGPVPP